MVQTKHFLRCSNFVRFSGCLHFKQIGKVAKEECKMLRMHKALDLMNNFEKL